MKERIVSNFQKLSTPFRKRMPPPSPIAISEILGFDPNELPDINPHGNFMNLGNEEQSIPEDVQNEFYDRTTNEWGSKHTQELIILPQHLFFAIYRPNQGEVLRHYAGWGEGISPSDQRFFTTHSVTFKKNPEGFSPNRVEYFYESPNDKNQEMGWESYCPSATIFIGDQTLRIDIEESQAKNFIQIEYDKDQLDRIYMDHESYSPFSRRVTDSMKIENGRLTLEHTRNNTDVKLKIPLNPQRDFFEKLFDDPRLLLDPLHAPLEADTSWKRANLMNIFNVSWCT